MTLPPERELIRLLTETVAPDANEAGLTSDCAIVPFDGTSLVATVDTFAAGTHFPPGTPPDVAGRFAAQAAMSDLAAAGAEVLGLLVGYGLPGDLTEAQARQLGRAIDDAVTAHDGEVLGGDTKPRPELSFSVTALGTCPAGTALTRRGAQPDDVLLVTGPLGGAGAALDRIQAGLSPRKADPLLAPTARIQAGLALRDAGAHACVDLSDGLADGAASIAETSGVRCVVDADAIPLHPWAEGEDDGLAWALETGGDYELLGMVAAETVERITTHWQALGLEPATVGRVEEGAGAVLATGGEERGLSRGYEHVFDA